MKEHGFTLSKFALGLRPYEKSVLNQDTAIECFNLIPRHQGLVEPDVVNQYVTDLQVNHPFPQIFLGATHWICCDKDKIYFINPDWSLTLILDLTSNYAANPSWEYQTWHFADFFDYVVLTNGYVTVYADQTSRTFKVLEPDSNMPILGTVCNFNGQILGSPKSSWHDADDNSLIWGGIGKASFAVDQSNTRGYRPMPWFGEVYKILKLGDFIGVYGSGGVAYLRFTETAPGLVRVLKYGIASRDAVGGDEDLHVFVDTAGNLRSIDAQLKVSDPMYREYLGQLLGNDIVVTYNPIEKDFYISDGVKCFVRTSEGLGEIGFGPTSMAVNAGELVGFYTDFNNSEGHVTTDALDFGVRARKTIDTIEVGAEASGDIQVAVDWRMNKSEQFQETAWRSVNAEGVVVFPIGGVEFKFKVRCSDYSGFKLSYIMIRLKFDDKRSKRGTSNVGKTTS